MEELLVEDNQGEVSEACQEDDQWRHPAQVVEQVSRLFLLFEREYSVFVSFVDVPGWGGYISSRNHQLLAPLAVLLE